MYASPFLQRGQRGHLRHPESSRHEQQASLTRVIVTAVCILAFAAQVGNAQELSAAEKQQVYETLTRAYRILDQSPIEAMRLLEEVIRRDPSNVPARRQLGSAYIAAGRMVDALQQFAIANVLFPSDTSRLQLAYLLHRLDRQEEAGRYFARLVDSRLAGISSRARTATLILSEDLCQARFPWWGRFSMSPYYDSRFENSIFSGSLHVGRYLGRQRAVSVFGMAGATRDTRSRTGAQPVILSDSYALAAAGIRVSPFGGLIVDLQAGGAIDLLDKGTEAKVREDVRALLFYGVGWFPELTTPTNVTFFLKPFADLYSSAGFYTRYHNTIGHSQIRLGVRVLEWKYSTVDIYLRGDGVWDSKREFYNNIVEASAGIRVNPYYPIGLSILVEQQRGAYWDTGLTTGVYDRYYKSFRILLIMDKSLCL